MYFNKKYIVIIVILLELSFAIPRGIQLQLNEKKVEYNSHTDFVQKEYKYLQKEKQPVKTKQRFPP